MTDYSKLSDVEISLAVGKLVSRDGISVVGHNGNAFIHHYSEPTDTFGAMCLGWKEVDYCNSWADAGPIIASNRISLRNRHEGDWQAVNEWGVSHSYIDKNPLRAAMVVFLMMNEGEG